MRNCGFSVSKPEKKDDKILFISGSRFNILHKENQRIKEKKMVLVGFYLCLAFSVLFQFTKHLKRLLKLGKKKKYSPVTSIPRLFKNAKTFANGPLWQPYKS